MQEIGLEAMVGARMPFLTSHTEAEADLLSRALPSRAVVLEAGCGRRSRLADHRDRITRLVGVDLDLVAGSENAALDEFVAADLGERLPFDDESFDLVYANFVIEHLEAPSATFREWRRVLRPGGALVFVTSNAANPYLAVARLFPDRARAFLKRRGPGVASRDVFPALYRANTPRDLQTQLIVAGFDAVATAYVATLHRYAGERPSLGGALRAAEHILPSRRRSTIVSWYERRE
jgi:SAM-dependent methyltransferase